MKKVIVIVGLTVAAAAAGLVVGGFVLAGSGDAHSTATQTSASAAMTTTVYRTQQVPVPSGPSYDEVWNRCYQAGESKLDEYYTHRDLADYCRQLASSVATN